MVVEKAKSQDFKTLLQEKTTYKCFCRVGVGADCSLHWHESLEICQLLSGNLKFLIDGVVYDMEMGDIVCINAAIPHRTYKPEKGAELRVFRVLSSNLLQIAPTIKPLKTYIPHSEISEIAGLEEKLNFILGMLTEGRDVSVNETSPYMQSLSASVYFLMMEHFAAEGETYQAKNKERKRFFQTLDYVNTHFTEPINVSIVARELFYPRSKLSAIFAKYSGARLGDYINGLRVQRANELMSEGESITDAAFLCGFQNIRTFNHIYKLIMGISPTEFLKRNT